MRQYATKSYFNDICQTAFKKGVKLPNSLKLYFEDEEKQLYLPFDTTIKEGDEEKMIRAINYYFK